MNAYFAELHRLDPTGYTEPLGVRTRAMMSGCAAPTAEGGELEAACARHADPTVAHFDACCLCGGHVRTGSIVVDGEFVHRVCYTEACARRAREGQLLRRERGPLPPPGW